MGIEQILFYVFSVILVFAATMVVTVRNPVFAALFLVLAFFTSAGIWLLLEAEFLALTLILVYVGAVMVLFLFVVMMLDINLATLKKGFSIYVLIGLVAALTMMYQLSTVVGPERFGLHKDPDPTPKAADYSNTAEIGRVLYTEYLYPFEIAAVILLVAIIAAIALTMRKRTRRQQLGPEEQVKVKRKDRVRLVKMATEKKQ
ncbi:MAG: NADH-quinone oxidoreductase subunit J [Gammaproteobacteria bacterium]|nr:NADH-quinone oxidoreductase subunit J [Gammaproteobacteria bacterium]MDH5800480.1 NADH-quinone oxidoreductase subunit J [Gammaproteobacteria bacterium]